MIEWCGEKLNQSAANLSNTIMLNDWSSSSTDLLTTVRRSLEQRDSQRVDQRERQLSLTRLVNAHLKRCVHLLLLQICRKYQPIQHTAVFHHTQRSINRNFHGFVCHREWWVLQIFTNFAEIRKFLNESAHDMGNGDREALAGHTGELWSLYAPLEYGVFSPISCFLRLWFVVSSRCYSRGHEKKEIERL